MNFNFLIFLLKVGLYFFIAFISQFNFIKGWNLKEYFFVKGHLNFSLFFIFINFLNFKYYLAKFMIDFFIYYYF